MSDPTLVALGLAATVLLAAAGAPVGADIELHLTDGRVLRALDAYREGSVYVVRLAGDRAITIPASLVEELRLSGPGDAPTGLHGAGPEELAAGVPDGPTGIRAAEPQVLAGVHVEPPTTAEQLDVLGEPSRFQPGVRSQEWTPESAFPHDADVLAEGRATWPDGVIDPDWVPRSALSEQDVLARGRSSWPAGVIDPRWTPEDGFRRASAWSSGPQGASVPGPMAWLGKPTSPQARRTATSFPDSTPVSGPRDPQGCANRLLRPLVETLPDAAQQLTRVRVLDDPRYEGLPFSVYEALLDAGGKSYRAVFAVSARGCHLFSGDPAELPLARGAAAYNEALGRGVAPPRSTRDLVDYAHAVVSLIDPAVGGARRAELRQVRDRAELEAIAEAAPERCVLAAVARQQERERAAASFAPPRIEPGSRGDVVRFVTWSAAGGSLDEVAVSVGSGGQIAVDRRALAAHLGAHRD